MIWQPTASIQNLKQRAKIIKKIRDFFAARDVFEVETPLLSHATVTDIHLQSFSTQYILDNQKEKKLYLQTSPEYAMKRLLAAGSGAIFQICKSFRNGGESGRLHNPEFTMLEWYRPGFNHHDLMDETDELLNTVLNTQPAERFTYEALFKHYLAIDPHSSSIDKLKQSAIELGIQIEHDDTLNSDDWLMLLMSHCIEPYLGQNNQPTFVYDFPRSQAALACINNNIAERFEVYLDGIELANGFHELSDAKEQRHRFESDLIKRTHINYPIVPIDEHLLSALEQGFPNSAGIALGIDRLIMIALKANSIDNVLSFPITNA